MHQSIINQSFGLNGHGTDVELRAQGSRPRTQKISEAKDSPFEDRPFLGQRHRRKCSPKKNNVFKNFFSGVLKKTKSKNFQKNKFFYKKQSTNF